MASILVVDDEVGIRELLSEILGDEGHSVVTAENAARARDLRVREQVDLVLLDIWMPDTDGVTLLKEWAANGQLNVPVIMMSGHATIDTAVEATRYGALEFLEKPIAMARLLSAVRSGLERGRVMRTLRATNTPSLTTPATPATPETARGVQPPTPVAEPEAETTHNGVPLDRARRPPRTTGRRSARDRAGRDRGAEPAPAARLRAARRLRRLAGPPGLRPNHEDHHRRRRPGRILGG